MKNSINYFIYILFFITMISHSVSAAFIKPTITSEGEEVNKDGSWVALLTLGRGSLYERDVSNHTLHSPESFERLIFNAHSTSLVLSRNRSRNHSPLPFRCSRRIL